MPTSSNSARSLSLIERADAAYQLAEQINARIEREDFAIADTPAIVEQPPVPAAPLASRPIPARLAAVDRTELADAGFILPDAPPTGLAEEFRIVKRHILQSAMGGQGMEPVVNGRAILVASAEPDEGKTYCAVNLALSLAREKDIDVLLVDADFAKPEILSTLGIAGGPGLVDALCDPAIDIESCVIRTDLANLSVLPAGRSLNEINELLASEDMRIIFEKLLSNPSRIVIFDSSPTLVASTGSVLSGLVGQALVVVRADMTGESELRETLNLLAGCAHVRLLLNAVQLQPRGRRFGSYYGYGG